MRLDRETKESLNLPLIVTGSRLHYVSTVVWFRNHLFSVYCSVKHVLLFHTIARLLSLARSRASVPCSLYE